MKVNAGAGVRGRRGEFKKLGFTSLLIEMHAMKTQGRK